MAIKEVRREWDECQLDYTKEFILHTEADVAKLPKCCTGSTAIVSETGNVYVSGKDKTWKKREEAMEEAGNTPSGGGGLPTGEAPHQMLVTDADGNTVWMERDFYKSVGAVIVPNDTYGIYSSYGQYVSGNFVLPTIGETYHVIFGDIETDKTAVAGNLGVRIGEEFSEFVIEFISETQIYVETANAGQKVIEITKQDLKKIDKEFIPELDIPIAAEDEYGTVKLSDLVGWKGTKNGAEKFNYEANSATAIYTHAEGRNTAASSACAHAEGDATTASGSSAHAEGNNTKASGNYSHAEGWSTVASGETSHAEGLYTTAASKWQHSQGKYNIEDTSNTYAHIVGNGTSTSKRSNAHTIDWDGNAWFAGTVEGTALILPSPDGSRWQITVGDDGTLSAVKI